MSSGRLSEGVGYVTWWGFSPARDLLSMGPARPEGDANVLLVGSGDPRHILKSIAGLQDKENLHVWVVESSMEVVARQLLLLYLALMPQQSMGNNEKAEIFLEIFGNSEIRAQTEEMLRCVASNLSQSVAETLETPTHSCLNTASLKFRERDELARILKAWMQPQSSSILISKAWDYRVRQHLGTRYNSKDGSFDWDLNMKLHEKGCGVIHKHQYARWRERGVAFELREGVYELNNPSLLSFRVFNQTAQDVSFNNVLALFVDLSARCIQPDAEEPLAEMDRKSVTLEDLMQPIGISVTFLPLDSLPKLAKKVKYSHFFSSLYFSASCVHQLDPTLRQIAAPDAALVVETAKYILDLNKEQEAGFVERVAAIAQKAEFEPWTEQKADGVHAVFVPQRN
ncbi:dynein axonemal assembly factor 3 isoform X2 [Nelusetta ayraudi]|uniref:dynein axonemal assembly factor 3 isoform X2 n=1 Tax=Nelusetta ayraudi TaxID=303726 RepID=UPI003F71AC97